MAARVSKVPRIADIQRRFDENGTLIRGQSPRGIWDDLEPLLTYCKAQRLDKLVMALESYEAERKRQNIAIDNLESQLIALSDAQRETASKYALLKLILEESGIDIDVLLKTHEVFAEKP